MTKKKAGAIFIAIAAFLAVIFWLVFGGADKVTARADAYTFDLSAYDVVYVVDEDCSVEVTETITINYSGYANTGFMRDIPIDGGVKIEHLKVYELIGGEECDVAYDVYFYTDGDGYNYLTADIGDTTRKNGEYTYVLYYTYIIPKQDTLLALNPVGSGWGCTINNATVTVVVPNGLIESSTKCYMGAYGSSNEYAYSYANNTITVSCDILAAYNGISLDLYFESGVLTSRVSFAPWIAVIIGLLIFGLLVALKLVKFNDPPLTPVVNFTAPEGMDPLNVGQLIDGNISDEDVTSLIYYWADKGYLKINMADENDPVLIRVYRNLPDGAPDYQKEMYAALFAGGDTVKISSLQQKFYAVIERVKKQCNVKKHTFYDKTSVTAATLFAVLGGLFAAIVPIILSMARISTKMFDVAYIIAAVPAIFIFMLTRQVYYTRLKSKKIKTVLKLIGIAVLGAACIAVYALLVPYMALETAPAVVVGIIALAIVMLSVTLIVRTRLYTEQLNGILGFRNFILYAEKDRLEALLEDDPQLYYHILPYAQVLGLTDKWENKFKALSVPPPQWMVDPLGTYVSFVVINRCLRVSFMSMNRHMTARPHQGGGGRGGFGGGFSGGFGGGVGGGFGGGGGRGR